MSQELLTISKQREQLLQKQKQIQQQLKQLEKQRIENEENKIIYIIEEEKRAQETFIQQNKQTMRNMEKQYEEQKQELVRQHDNIKELLTKQSYLKETKAIVEAQFAKEQKVAKNEQQYKTRLSLYKRYFPEPYVEKEIQTAQLPGNYENYTLKPLTVKATNAFSFQSVPELLTKLLIQTVRRVIMPSEGNFVINLVWWGFIVLLFGLFTYGFGISMAFLIMVIYGLPVVLGIFVLVCIVHGMKLANIKKVFKEDKLVLNYAFSTIQLLQKETVRIENEQKGLLEKQVQELEFKQKQLHEDFAQNMRNISTAIPNIAPIDVHAFEQRQVEIEQTMKQCEHTLQQIPIELVYLKEQEENEIQKLKKAELLREEKRKFEEERRKLAEEQQKENERKMKEMIEQKVKEEGEQWALKDTLYIPLHQPLPTTNYFQLTHNQQPIVFLYHTLTSDMNEIKEQLFSFIRKTSELLRGQNRKTLQNHTIIDQVFMDPQTLATHSDETFDYVLNQEALKQYMDGLSHLKFHEFKGDSIQHYHKKILTEGDLFFHTMVPFSICHMIINDKQYGEAYIEIPKDFYLLFNDTEQFGFLPILYINKEDWQQDAYAQQDITKFLKKNASKFMAYEVNLTTQQIKECK